MTIGEKIQKLRKQNGWSQEELASRISVSRQTLSKWELGVTVPDTENVVAICKLFQISADDLLQIELNFESGSIQQKQSISGHAVRVICGTGILVCSLLGLLVLGILSSVCPATYIEAPADQPWVRATTGFWGFVFVHNLLWLVLLCAIGIVGGATALFYQHIKGILLSWKDKVHKTEKT